MTGLDELVTLTEAAWVANASPSTVRSWAHRGLLKPAATQRGRKLYRAVDILDLERDTRRTVARRGGRRRTVQLTA